MKIDIKKNIPYILLFLYILLFYIFGNDSSKTIYSELIIVLIGIVSVAKIIKSGELKYNNSYIMIGLFILFCFMSTLWAINSDRALAMTKTLVILYVFYILLWQIFENNLYNINRILKIICLCGFLFAIYIILYYGIIEFIKYIIVNGRINNEIANANEIGTRFLLSGLIAFYYYLYENKRKYLFIFIFMFLMIICSGSRTSLLCLIIGIFLLYFFNPKSKINVSNILKISVIIIILLLILRLPLFEDFNARMEQLINSFNGTGEIDNSTLVRQGMISSGLKQFMETPFLGIGINNSNIITLELYDMDAYLHNNFVELLACTGIIGFILFYASYAYILIYSLNKIIKKKYIFTIIFTITAIKFISSWGSVFYYSKMTFIELFIAFLTISYLKKEEKNEKNYK